MIPIGLKMWNSDEGLTMTEDQKNDFANATLLRRNGDFDGAVATLQKLSQELPQSVIIALTLGDTYCDLKQLEVALSYFSKAVFLKPSSEIASLALFHCLLKLDRSDDAFDEMRRFLTDNDSEEYKRLLDSINNDAVN